MISEAQKIAEKIQNRLQQVQNFDISALNSHIESDKDQIIHDELLSVPDLLKKRIETEFFGFGPLDPLISDPDVTEIIINNAQSIWFEKNGIFEKLNDQFLTEITYDNFVQRMLRWIKGQVTLDRPFLCEHYNNLRVHICGSAVTEGQTLISIRKHKMSSWTFADFEKVGWAASAEIRIIQNLIRQRQNIIVIGPTGSGKTSVLNAIMSEMKSNERILILEDTNELHVPNSCSAKILTREDAQNILMKIDLSDLLRQSLRMRPDRIVVGEIRGAEAKDLLMTLSTGHAGSLGTLHAGNPQEAMLRLEMLVQLGAPQWSLEAIRKLVFLSIQNLIVIGFDENRKRKLKGIYKVAGIESFGVTLDPLYQLSDFLIGREI